MSNKPITNRNLTTGPQTHNSLDPRRYLFRAGNGKKKPQRHLFMRYVHLNGSLCAFSPFYRHDLMIHSHINHVVSHSQDLDSFHITNTANKLFPVFQGLVHFISNRMFMYQYSRAPYKQRIRQCP